ncbi:MAG: hypothetical protein GU359_02650 [Desulfurococcales archaeon]|nr:hypothetical protein [Desulfurococcales archaeon]NAZ13038.1 hypothetical protein [Desulfurococcales archaeon]
MTTCEHPITKDKNSYNKTFSCSYEYVMLLSLYKIKSFYQISIKRS